MTTRSYGAKSRRPVYSGSRRVSGLYERSLADGTVQTHIQRTVPVTPRSTFFFVPIKYWWIVLTALG